MSEVLIYKNGFMKKIFFILILAIAFWSCKKDFTKVAECRIVSASVIETGSTNAVFKIEVAYSADWNMGESVGIGLYDVNWDELTYSMESDWGNSPTLIIYKATVEGLQSGRTYYWKPYIRGDSIWVWGEMYHFTTEME